MRGLQRLLCIVSVVSTSLACLAQTDSAKDYAGFCYGQLGIKPADLPATWDCGKGTLLTTFKNDIPLAKLPAKALDPARANHLPSCDTPAWLGSGGAEPSQCYDATYLTNITIPGNSSFQGALFCRHKISDSTALNDFDDVAIIMNNKVNGKTCWFQTEEGASARVDGRTVPRPDTDTAGYWLKPSQTAGSDCARCHDNGPWMNSQWLYSQKNSFRNNPDNFYSTPVYTVPAAAPAPEKKIFNWPETNNFVDVGKLGLLPPDGTFNPAEQAAQQKLPTCTSCHKLSGKVTWFARTNFTWSAGAAADAPVSGWFSYVTGGTRPSQANTLIAKDYDHTRWMPTGNKRPGKIIPSPTPAATYDKLYKKHLEELRKCMGMAPADRTPPSSCANRDLAFNSAPAGVGAAVAALDMGTGIPYTAVAVPMDDSVPPVPNTVARGTMLQLGWHADASFVACTIEATLPPGVLVSSTTGTIGTGSNWPLPQSPPKVGPLTEPGIYDFSIYCGETYTASLQFEIEGPQHPMLSLATLTNSQTRADAVDSVSLKRTPTTTDVLASNPAELIWTSYNVKPDCTVTGPGVSGTGEAGSATVAVSGTADQAYTFACTGDDGLPHSVTAILHPLHSNVCNLNAEAVVIGGAPNNPGSIQIAWTDTSGDPNFSVDHYNIYASQSENFNSVVALSGPDSDPFVASPVATNPSGQPIAFTGSGAIAGTSYYLIAPASASNTEYWCPVIGSHSASGGSSSGGGIQTTIQPEAWELVQLANQAREAAGLKPLQWDPRLAEAARQHCLRMIAEGAMAHDFPGELDVEQRAAQAGARFSAMEENVAIDGSPAAIHGGWMSSPEHRANILSPDVDRVGIALVAGGAGLYAVADYERGVPTLTQSRVEAAVAGLLRPSTVALLNDTADARSLCVDDGKITTGDKPGFLMVWQATELTRLPPQLAEKVASGQFHEAAVGSCPAQIGTSSFSAYRVAVLLY